MAQPDSESPLRTGFTTGACAAAAVLAALIHWYHRRPLTEVEIALPKNQQLVSFAIHQSELLPDGAQASVIKDAGDDPDVTHGAEIVARLTVTPHDSDTARTPRVDFFAGPGVGTVTKPGLPLAVGEPAINPVPRAMIAAHLRDAATQHSIAADFAVTLSIPNGEALAQKTWNPRLGIVGGLSILGTTGIVKPYSCAAWIHSIHRGIDVARAMGLKHIAASTGNLSEAAVQKYYNLSVHALIDMGDFATGMLKYLRQHPIDQVTICGGFGKMLKLAAGHGDLHSARSQTDFAVLSEWAEALGLEASLVQEIRTANSAHHLLQMLRDDPEAMRKFLHETAARAQTVSHDLCDGLSAVEVMLIDRSGELIYPC